MALADTKFRLNQYRPIQDVSRLINNRHVAWPYRLVFGLPTTLVIDVLLPGRLFPWGDYYNPWTNTVHLYSDHPAVALHEAGHAYDSGRRHFKGTYAAIRLIPFVGLYQEAQATDEAITHFIETGEQQQELAAYKILYPAMGVYAGNYLFTVGGPVIGAAIGHIYGHAKAYDRAKKYERMGVRAQPPSRTPRRPVITPAVRPSVEPSTDSAAWVPLQSPSTLSPKNREQWNSGDRYRNQF